MISDKKIQPKADVFFEVSYEVANKVGGIYTVIKSKIPSMVKYYGQNYFLIGFYNQNNARYEFIQTETPPEFKTIVDNLLKLGIKCFYGRWATPDEPKILLLDIENFKHKLNEIKTKLWDWYGIDSIQSDWWFDEPVCWSWATGLLLEEVAKSKAFKSKKIVSQFHEWMSGVALLYLKHQKIKIGSVFTTHATMLGRTMASMDKNFQTKIYEELKQHNSLPKKEEYKYRVQSKHQTEVNCAKYADAFTTVSEVTGDESQYILGKKPDVLLPNGLTLDAYPSMEEIAIKHTEYKKEIIRFLKAYFLPYYRINTDDPRILFLSGRYEFTNKGIHFYINALGKLNEQLKKEKSNKDVFAFLFVPADIVSEKEEVITGVGKINIIENDIEQLYDEFKETLLDIFCETDSNEIDREIKEFLLNVKIKTLKKQAIAFKRPYGTPPLCAFNLRNADGDPIMRSLRYNGLLNRKEDRVKIIFYPAYLSSTDRLLSMDYDEIVTGCSCGIFPSLYEP
ncbi:MAG: glycogen/starch synthase, partial [Candidatus Aenigmarchaeota archaeon]|nr:glycogen/starch synthase [Candidatus Aenigmarchaeota archaeon]